MTEKYDKLKTLLMELFQLDQLDLDFGLYRVMHAKSAEVTGFQPRSTVKPRSRHQVLQARTSQSGTMRSGWYRAQLRHWK